MRTGKDDSRDRWIMLAQVGHQVNDPPQGMTLMINNPMAQEVTKIPYGPIMV